MDYKIGIKPELEDNGVEIKVAGNKGRGLFATRTFIEGDIILEESPVISCQFAWNKALGYAACDHCLRPLETATENIRRLLKKNEQFELMYEHFLENNKSYQCMCPNCKVQYCSSACQKTARDQYHNLLCFNETNRAEEVKFEKLLDVWKQMHYPPESTTIFLIVRILAMVKNKNQYVLDSLNSFNCNIDSDQMEHKIATVKFAEQIDLLRDCVIECFGQDFNEQLLSPDGFMRLLAMVGRNGQGIGTSPFSDYITTIKGQLNSDEEDKFDIYLDELYSELEDAVGLEFINNEGSGLYEVQSKCNHSCDPNVEVTFPNGNFTLALRTLKEIRIGDEICISYIDECMRNRSRHSRQKYLRENYVFQCSCKKCEVQADELDETSEDDEMSVEEEEQEED